MYEGALVDSVEANMADRISLLEATRDQFDVELQKTILTTELTRIRYLLRCYLRTRLHKIQAHVMHVVDTPSLSARLSPKELNFAREYCVMFAMHLKQTVGQNMPDNYQSLVRQVSHQAEKDMVPSPCLDAFVFCRVLEDVGYVVVDDEGQQAQFQSNDIFVTQYRNIQHLLMQDRVELI
ncbi:hypothetical protein H632_c790p1 [Helicosporidium sp. ATCC 50920]|nr:hypothetical protein H632_c790p1 [Helicosporidium sp. ATCC 50920]|eukprot:KDD75241.1 hypothetical protein H632_c790p1 [Helicosporidium sp. ATCC 50920]